MDDKEIVDDLSKSLGLIKTSEDHSFSKQQLAEKINDLINSDFQKLVSILYRMDVSEAKLKLLLKENPTINAGIIIADLMIERQIQKLKDRQRFKRDENISDDEKW